MGNASAESITSEKYVELLALTMYKLVYIHLILGIGKTYL